MKINIISFGNIGELITGSEENIEGIADTDQFKRYLEHRYATLRTIKYTLAVNNRQVQQNTPLTEGATVAIMPPFSGG